MPKQRRPNLGRYQLTYPKSEIKYNGTVKKFQRWRRRQQQQRKLSRRINRGT